MASLTDAMSAQTCATIAQIAPVFLVALVAERIVFRSSPRPAEQRRRIAVVLIRVGIDTIIAVALLLLTMLVVAGVETEGLTGRSATYAWFGFVSLAIAVIYRWLLLSTPLLSILNIGAQRWAEWVAQATFQVAEWLGWLIGRSILPGLANVVAQVISIASDVIIGILTVGLVSPVNSVATLLSGRARRGEVDADLPPGRARRDA